VADPVFPFDTDRGTVGWEVVLDDGGVVIVDGGVDVGDCTMLGRGEKVMGVVSRLLLALEGCWVKVMRNRTEKVMVFFIFYDNNI
jgi:hypothetical protein